MSARFEAFLALIYVDERAREAYLADPSAETARAGLDAADRAALARVDATDLRLAARGFAWKRAHKPRRRLLDRIRRSWRGWWMSACRDRRGPADHASGSSTDT